MEQTTTLDVNIGGAELNIAIGISRLGLKAAWVSKLPDNPLGRMIGNKARELGVDISHVIWIKKGRTGLYFLEFGATPRYNSVLYDRANSSFSTIKIGEINWNSVLNRVKCFHMTGITPALSQSAAAVTLDVLQKAKKVGCKVSVDLNYRQILWSPESARKTLQPMMDFVDILIFTRGNARILLGLEASDDLELAKKLLDQYPLEVVALSIREGGSVLKCRWSAVARSKKATFKTKTYDVDIIDQVGRGDSFAAGFLYGYVPEGGIQLGLDYGTAFAALKHSFPGDFNWCTREEVEELLKEPQPGIIK